MKLNTLSQASMNQLFDKLVAEYSALDNLKDKTMLFKRLQEYYPPGEDKFSLLHYAILYRHKTVTAVLLNLDFKVDVTFIKSIARGMDIEFTHWLIDTYGFKLSEQKAFLRLLREGVLSRSTNEAQTFFSNIEEYYRSYLSTQLSVSSDTDAPPVQTLEPVGSIAELEERINAHNPRHSVFHNLYAQYRHPISPEGLDCINALEPLFNIKLSSLKNLESQVLQLLTDPAHQNKPYTPDLAWCLFAIQTSRGNQPSQEYVHLFEEKLADLKRQCREELLNKWLNNLYALLLSVTITLAITTIMPAVILPIALYLSPISVIFACVNLILALLSYLALCISAIFVVCKYVDTMALFGISGVYFLLTQFQFFAKPLTSINYFFRAYSVVRDIHPLVDIHPENGGLLFALLMLPVGIIAALSSLVTFGVGIGLTAAASGLGIVTGIARQKHGFFRPADNLDQQEALAFKKVDDLMDRVQAHSL